MGLGIVGEGGWGDIGMGMAGGTVDVEVLELGEHAGESMVIRRVMKEHTRIRTGSFMACCSWARTPNGLEMSRPASTSSLS